jgi:diguanylate cyclase (GGDEF)-like protein/PAS domain S-box-containing protein
LFAQSTIVPTVEVLQALLDSIPNPVIVIDREHRLVLVNQAMADFMGRPREALLGQTGAGLLPQAQLEVFWRIDDQVFATGLPNENEEIVTGAGGRQRIVITRKRLIHLDTAEGRAPFIVAVISDVTRFREAEARAHHLAAHDLLTGLPNRGQLTLRLAQALAAARSSGEVVGLLLVDLDGFKPINDQFGHLVGDNVLRIVARRLSGVIRAGDTVARLGGDEFCVIQLGIRDAAQALHLADRIVAAIGHPFATDPEPIVVSASVGVALCPFDGDDPETLLDRADRALYAVKHAGRGSYRRYEASMQRLSASPVMRPAGPDGAAAAGGEP